MRINSTPSGNEVPDDAGREPKLIRPRTLQEYIGQDRIKEKLRVFISAALDRGEALDHVLFYGPPGLGKTTIATIIAHELGVHLESTSGPALERPGDLAAILTSIPARGVLFIDEIHRLTRIIEEKLYPAMEDYYIDLVVGQGPAARIIPLQLEKFTLIGATTRFGALGSPLRDRFGVVCRLDYYQVEDLFTILQRSAQVLGIAADNDGLREIAKRARGTPRIANRMLRRVRDFAQIQGDGTITRAIADRALTIMEIDDIGLDSMDRKLLTTIIDHFEGGPVGLETLAASLSESKETIEDVYEPFLIQRGLLKKTPKGRVVTARGFAHFRLPPPLILQQELDFDTPEADR